MESTPATPKPATASPALPGHGITTASCVLAGLLALAVAMGIGRFAFTPVMPMMMADSGLTIAQGGWLASSNYLGYLVGALLGRYIAGMEQNVIRYGLLVTGVVTMAMGLHLALPAMLGLRFAAGVASALVLVAVSSWTFGILAQRQLGHLSGVVFTGVGSGVAAAGLLCLVLVAAGASSATAWASLGVCALLVPLLLWRRYGSGVRAAAAGNPAASRALRWSGLSARLVFCYGVFGFGYILPATFLPVMARRALENPALVGWAWPVFGLAAAISTLFAGTLARRYGTRRSWIGAHLLMAAGVALPAWRENGWTVFIAAIFVGATFMLVTVFAMQEAKRLAGERATPLIAAMTASFAAGQIAGPLSISLGLGRDGDFATGLVIAAALLVASAALLALPDEPAAPGAAPGH
ncbi:MAG: putative arabinose efflux permease, family [Paucimonas sp.]|nr:putative arabinose efflux permease, family [Paucimonas sp.]